MKSAAKTPADYLISLPADRQAWVQRLRNTIATHLPDGFDEVITYGMLSWVVPHAVYPSGYHCDPKVPLPFISLASQKNYVALYHMGLYSDPRLLNWFAEEYAQLGLPKLDMGKSCIRFKQESATPFELIGALCEKISPEAWIRQYESAIKP
jgi:uncharacterized protein YdhG (YjbR/CyaY superfamily)